MSPKCEACGHKLVQKTLPRYEAGPILGMRSVIIENLPALVCVNRKCKAKSVIIDGALIDRMHAALLLDVASRSRICGEEVRFIRKALELSQAELADRLGVHRVTVARWETGEIPLDGPTSIAVRALAAIPAVAKPGPELQRVVRSFEKPPTAGDPETYRMTLPVPAP